MILLYLQGVGRLIFLDPMAVIGAKRSDGHTNPLAVLLLLLARLGDLLRPELGLLGGGELGNLLFLLDDASPAGGVLTSASSVSTFCLGEGCSCS